MSLDTKFYGEDIKNIKNVKFNIFTNKEVKGYSALKNDPFGINVPDSYEGYEPKKGGLVDLRLGTCDAFLHCTTCGLNSMDCPGHFGHTELAEPVFHIGFLNHLKSILQCVCLRCSNILVERTEENLKEALSHKTKVRFKTIKDITKNISFCWNCGSPVPKIRKDIKEKNATINIILEREVGTTVVDEQTGEKSDMKKKIHEILTPRQCYNILRNISDTDCYILGFNPKVSRPEDLIIKRFPIPPVCIRPTGKIDFISASTMEDALTLKIADIIKANIRVREKMDKQASGIELNAYETSFNTLLQYHIAIYFDNDTASLPQSMFKTGNRPLKSIRDRIKGKPGRVRANLMGKRVDFSARSVITSDPYINIDEVGVPLRIAKNLTIPEEVTPQNIKYLKKLVKNGATNYPGANYVNRVNYINGKAVKQHIDLKYRKRAIKLEYGDVVLRHIVNGDYVLFNRQPTLHKPSMMGHKIHVLENDDANTFRMNVSVCGPYNADFDKLCRKQGNLKGCNPLVISN
jgi:DNA-directed RNA polymerase II subunit RPB1